MSGATPALGAIEEALAAQGGLPSLGLALGRLVGLLESDREALHDLADLILSEVSLTERLLRLANTVQFRASSGTVTTITRAIMVLGFDRVRDAALSLILLEGLLGSPEAKRVQSEFERTWLASTLARELQSTQASGEAEEAAIAAMFRRIGRLIVAAYAPETLAEIDRRSGGLEAGERGAARQVLGTSFEALSARVLRKWQLPERVIAAIQPIALSSTPARGADRVRLVAQFSAELADALAGADAQAAVSALIEEHAVALAIAPEALLARLATAQERVRELQIACGMPRQQVERSDILSTVIEEARLEAPAVEPGPAAAGGRPVNARALLVAGLSDVTEALARGERAEQVGLIVLEAIHRGLGYARTTWVGRDASGVFRSRAGFGEPRMRLEWTPGASGDLFSAALAQGADLHIRDTAAEKIQARLPEWFGRACPHAASFLLMPLMLQGRALGFFYAERHQADEAGLDAEELALLRALRSQVLFGLRQTPSRI